MVKFMVGWWFKHHGRGSVEPIKYILLNIPTICKEYPKRKSAHEEVWIPPAIGVLKFNVDGATKGCPGSAGIGGVLRNSCGKVLCLFSCQVGVQRANTAEILAILKACRICLSRSDLIDKEIMLVSDSKVAVSWVLGEGIGNIDNWESIYDIKECLKVLPRLSVVFSSRASNSFTDNLAKRGSMAVEDLMEWSMDG